MNRSRKALICICLAASIPVLAATAAGAGKLSFGFGGDFGTTGRGRDQLESPAGIAVFDDGTVAVADKERNTVVIYDKGGRWQRSLGQPRGEGGAVLKEPSGVAFDRAGRIWVADRGNDRIVALNRFGGVLLSIGGFGLMKGEFRKPQDVAVDKRGRIYVADTGNKRIQVLDPSGVVLEVWKDRSPRGDGPIQKPVALAFSAEGDGFIWLANSGSAKLKKLDLKGEAAGELDLAGVAEGEIRVVDFAVDPDFDRMFICDAAKNRILVLNGRGDMLTTVELPQGSEATSLAVSWSVDLYVADGGKRRIIVYDKK